MTVLAKSADENTEDDNLRMKIARATGMPVLDLRPYAAGQNTRLFLADMQGGSRLVAKVATDGKARLDIEGWMLSYLAHHSNVPVPYVFQADNDFLLMSWLMGGGPMDKSAQQHAADLLCDLHNVRGAQYGLERDTTIGPLHQPNSQSETWLTFFRDNRLRYMARTALDAGAITAKIMADIDRLSEKLDNFIDEPRFPSLIHGDIWGGNVMSWQGRITGFLDPALYYADSEMELAFVTLFKTFDESFFAHYHEKRGIRAGFFDGRRDIYNLYPLLAHAVIFGGTYAASVEKTLRRFI